MTDVTFEQLARMWQDHDPVPAGLTDRVLVAIAMEDLDEEYEILHLVDRSRELAGVRHAADDAVTIAFTHDDVSLLLRVSRVDDERRVDGWLAPPRAAQVTVRRMDGEWVAACAGTGRFEFERVPSGLCRIVVSVPADDENGERTTLFATPTFEL